MPKTLERWLAKRRHAPAAPRATGDQFSRAFDFALEQVTGVEPLFNRKYTIEDARLAVKASQTQCGPVARAAEHWLQTHGVSGVEFHFLEMHYVLLDRATGMLHDLDVPEGRRSKEDLPIWHRYKELAQLKNTNHSPTDVDNIFERHACEWLTRRQDLAGVNPLV